jgi:hypothetical protein
MRRTTSLVAVVSLTALVGSLPGCSKKDKVVDVVLPPAAPPATTQGILIDNFILCYSKKNIDVYQNTVHHDFRFFFAEQDVAMLGVPATGWSRQQDIDSATKMFNGSTGTRPDGSGLPGIQSIALRLTPLGDGWSQDVDMLFAGTLRRSYEVLMTVTFASGATAMVCGVQDFYVVQVVVGGQTIWQLKYWVDVGATCNGVAATTPSAISWGVLKALYRN